MPDLVGQTLQGRYRIETLIGRGGMAEVYKAWDTRRQYHVAIKVMREDLAEDIEFLRRFKQEAQALAVLSHINIVRFYSFEREGRLAFIVMDYVDGTTLRGRILDAGGRPLPFPSPNSNWNEMMIKCLDGQYMLYFNGRLAYTSQESSFRPRYIWIGYPADLGVDCQWDTLEVDYIMVESLP